MSKLDKYRQELKKLENSDSYWTHSVIDQFVSELERSMNVREINKAQFARRAGVSASYITKVMNGNANLSMESMTKLARVVGGTVHVHIAPQGIACDWFDHYGISTSDETSFADPAKGQRAHLSRVTSDSTATGTSVSDNEL